MIVGAKTWNRRSAGNHRLQFQAEAAAGVGAEAAPLEVATQPSTFICAFDFLPGAAGGT